MNMRIISTVESDLDYSEILTTFKRLLLYLIDQTKNQFRLCFIKKDSFLKGFNLYLIFFFVKFSVDSFQCAWSDSTKIYCIIFILGIR